MLQLIAGTVPSLALVDSSGAQARLMAKQCVHALAEALEQPDAETVTALVNFASSARGVLIACVESLDAQRNKTVAAELRQIVATTMASLGCIAERSVLMQDVTVCAIIADCLIEVAGSEEVGSGVGGTPDAATAIPELARYVLFLLKTHRCEVSLDSSMRCVCMAVRARRMGWSVSLPRAALITMLSIDLPWLVATYPGTTVTTSLLQDLPPKRRCAASMTGRLPRVRCLAISFALRPIQAHGGQKCARGRHRCFGALQWTRWSNSGRSVRIHLARRSGSGTAQV